MGTPSPAGANHIKEAERLLKEASAPDLSIKESEFKLQQALVHATLAVAYRP
jgi:hypothetical protein